MAKIAESKKKVVAELADLLSKYSIIAAVNMENLPTKQLQNMRAQLRGTVVLRVAKKRLIRIAIDKVKDKKPGIEKLKDYLKGMPGLLFTNDNPFKLFKTLEKNKSTAPAKAGQIAPKNILVQAGATNFAPGPIIGELGAVGIKTGVEGGKLAIKEDKIVAKEGDEISANLASVLLRLGVEPMEIGLDLVAAYEDGTIFDKKVLRIDEKEFIDNITKAQQWAFNLSVEAAIPNKDNIELLITKAFRDSKGLALEQNIMADAVTEELVGKAANQAKGFAANIKYDADTSIAKTETTKKEPKKIEEPKKKAPEEQPSKPHEEKEVKEEVIENTKKEEPKKVEEPKKKAPEEEVNVEKVQAKTEEAMDVKEEVKKSQDNSQQSQEKEVELPKSASQIVNEAQELNKKLGEEKKLKEMKAKTEKKIETNTEKEEKVPTAAELVEKMKKGQPIRKAEEKVPTIAELAAAKKKEKKS